MKAEKPNETCQLKTKQRKSRDKNLRERTRYPAEPNEPISDVVIFDIRGFAHEVQVLVHNEKHTFKHF